MCSVGTALNYQLSIGAYRRRKAGGGRDSLLTEIRDVYCLFPAHLVSVQFPGPGSEPLRTRVLLMLRRMVSRPSFDDLESGHIQSRHLPAVGQHGYRPQVSASADKQFCRYH